MTAGRWPLRLIIIHLNIGLSVYSLFDLMFSLATIPNSRYVYIPPCLRNIMDGHTPPARKLRAESCMDFKKNHPTRVKRVVKDSMRYEMSWKVASNPETWGLDPAKYTPLGMGIRDNGTLRMRSYCVYAWFVVEDGACSEDLLLDGWRD